ncbi:MAG TPA: SDR family oxidoreductase [Terriglobales bacterium]|nr:SDR family oxidoreductase [Terriglobales bacterium]
MTRTPASGRLGGKTAVITGGSRGIGYAIAQAFAAEGCNLVLAARSAANLRRAVNELSSQVSEIAAIECDVRQEKSVENLFARVRQGFERIDILVNNAGISQAPIEIERLEPRVWREVVDTDLTSLFLCTRAALPLMGSGAIVINNISMSGYHVFPKFSAYTAAKHGALGFTDALREEVRARQIRVMALLPGATDTDIWQAIWPEAPREKMVSPRDVAAAVLNAVLLPPNTTVEEIRINPTQGPL